MRDLVYYLEDDEDIAYVITQSLDTINLDVEVFTDYRLFVEKIKSRRPALLLIDLMLPQIDGLEVLKYLKSSQNTKNIPTMVVSARISEYDRVSCLEAGAEDYMTKPCSVLEFITRVKSMLRRNMEEEYLICGDIFINPKMRTVTRDNVMIDLTNKEFDLFKYLVENKGAPVSRDDIIKKVWGYEKQENTRTIDMHIKSVRRKVFNNNKGAINTVFKVGYVLVYGCE